MYVYCGNNPITNLDMSGYFWKEIGDWFIDAGREIGSCIKLMYESFVFYVCVGFGVGGSVENSGLEVSALVRSDLITLRKDAGSEFYVGKADETYMSLEGACSSIPDGYKKFYNLDGSVRTNEELEPHYEGVLSTGGTIAIPFLCFAVTFEIGYDWEYTLTELFLKGDY